VGTRRPFGRTMSLICQYTKIWEDHWVCTGLYKTDFLDQSSDLAECGCKCHANDYKPNQPKR